MRLIRTDKVPDGSTLGRDIITGRDAVPLLRAGVSIDQRYRDALQKAGIHAIYIADEHSEGILPVPAISDEARLLTTRAVSAAFDEAKRSIAAGKSLPTAAANSLTQVVERILLEIEETDVASLVLNNNACADAYIVQHAIDVTSLGLIMGRRLMGEQGWTDHRGQRQHGKRDERLARLGMGLLLHDIGKLAVPAEILHKPDKLTDSDWEVMRTHPRAGLDLIRDSSAWCPLVHAVVLRHHERWDGSGYPDGKQGDEIHEMARIAAVADAYLAITSERVTRRRGRRTRGSARSSAAPRPCLTRWSARSFRGSWPLPAGIRHRAFDGRRGIVVSVPEDELDRPLVRVISGPNAPYEISLLDDRSIQIAGWGRRPAGRDRGVARARVTSPRSGRRPQASPSAADDRADPTSKGPAVRFLISSVRRQLLAAFMGVSAIFLVAIALGWTGIGAVDAKVHSSAKEQQVLEQASGSARDLAASELATVINPKKQQDHEADVAAFQKTIATLKGYATSQSALDAVGSLNSAFTQWQSVDQQVLSTLHGGDLADAMRIAAGPADQAVDQLTTAVAGSAPRFRTTTPRGLQQGEQRPDRDADPRGSRPADRRDHQLQHLARRQRPRQAPARRDRRPRCPLPGRARGGPRGDRPRRPHARGHTPRERDPEHASGRDRTAHHDLQRDGREDRVEHRRLQHDPRPGRGDAP